MTVGEQHLTGKPGGVPWEEAGALVVAGTTAYAADRIRRAASKVDAFIDTFGAGYVQLALELGVEPSRINTIVNFEAVARYGVRAEGNAAASTASVLAELASLIAPASSSWPSRRRSRRTGSRTPTGGSRRATFSERSSCCRRQRRERTDMARAGCCNILYTRRTCSSPRATTTWPTSIGCPLHPGMGLLCRRSVVQPVHPQPCLVLR